MLDLSVIIPFKDKASMTIDCLESIYRYAPALKEVLLASNNSSKEELGKVRSAAKQHDNAQVMTHDIPFNFQEINNWAARKTAGKVIMLLNNDVELIPNSGALWQEMYDQACKARTGAVGSVLLYGDQKRIQHGGIYLVAGQTADHLYIGSSFETTVRRIAQSSDLPNIVDGLEVTAVTAAALMVARTKFDEVGGLDEAFIICGGDVDLCLRLKEHGYKNMLVGSKHGQMLHKESASRSAIAIPYVDFCESYRSYIRHFDTQRGDPCVSIEEIKHAK